MRSFSVPENTFVSKLNLSTHRVVLLVIEILYVPWKLSCYSFKLTIESASFKQSAISLRLYHSSEYWAPCFYVNLVMGVGGGVKEKHNDCLLNKYLI